MSNPNILNLDDLDTQEKVIKLDGVEHHQVELTVEAYIERVQRARERDKEDENAPFEVKILRTIDNLVEMYPTMTAEQLRKLSLGKLNKLLNFALTAPQDIADKVQSQAEGNQSGNA